MRLMHGLAVIAMSLMEGIGRFFAPDLPPANEPRGYGGWDGYPASTATTWHPPVGAFFRRRGKARWKHLRRVRG